MQNKTISILGGGWLGTPLSSAIEKKGGQVKISTASDENYKRLKEMGKAVFQIKVQSQEIIGTEIALFLDSDILIINITPNRDELEQEQFASLLPLIEASRIQQVLFVSSTSVYRDINGPVMEDDKAEKEEHHLYRSEQFLSNSAHFKTTVVRMAGLVGGERHPGRFFRKTGLIRNANAPINLIHREDCIQILLQIIEQNVWGEVFNACADTHPLKKDFYPVAAQSIGLDPPTALLNDVPMFKLVENQKVKKELGLQLKYPDLLELLKEGNWA